jgi:hypothetical protein
MSRNGLHISLEFFEDVLIPEHYLPEPSIFDEVLSEAWTCKDAMPAT